MSNRYKYPNIESAADKEDLYECLTENVLVEIEKILEAYGNGKIDLFIPRDEYDEIDWDRDMEVIIKDENYKQTGAELLILKWWEDHEDTGYMIECMAESNIYTIDELWGAACSGNIDFLKGYYEKSKGERNRRYEKFGNYHSLIMGAFRTGNFDTVEYLLSIGECITEDEGNEFAGYYANKIIHASHELADYFRYHNKNLTKKQYDLFEKLESIVKEIPRG